MNSTGLPRWASMACRCSSVRWIAWIMGKPSVRLPVYARIVQAAPFQVVQQRRDGPVGSDGHPDVVFNEHVGIEDRYHPWLFFLLKQTIKLLLGFSLIRHHLA